MPHFPYFSFQSKWGILKRGQLIARFKNGTHPFSPAIAKPIIVGAQDLVHYYCNNNKIPHVGQNGKFYIKLILAITKAFRRKRPLEMPHFRTFLFEKKPGI